MSTTVISQLVDTVSMYLEGAGVSYVDSRRLAKLFVHTVWDAKQPARQVTVEDARAAEGRAPDA